MKQKNKLPKNFPRGKVAYFVTSNVHKFQEARRILLEYNISAAKLKIEAVEIQDISIETIAKYSVQDAVKKCNLPVFVEDAGLFISALNGFPGPYSKYVYDTVGVKGILKLMKEATNRDAYFRSVIAYSTPEERPICFIGNVTGKLSVQSRGTAGFGYDPIFIPLDGDGKTFGEMSIAEKNMFSHRAEALRKFAEWYS